jgi:twitching motility protein PilT
MPKETANEKLDRWLYLLIAAGGSDLHIKTNSPLKARVKSDIVLLSKEIADRELLDAMIRLLTDKEYEKFLESKEFDGAYTLEDDYRFRCNIYEHVDGYAIAFRLIPPKIRTIEELNLPSALYKLTELRRGLVLVTGITGSGKTTTLATIIEEINQKYNRHIITIEDPVEYIFHDKKSIIEQREFGTHTKSFSKALRSALREDPDIIVVGEIRDLATAESIIHAVNTGHLVFSTIHTLNAKETIDRLIGLFPTSEQNRVRQTIAATLEACVSQRLIEGTDGTMIPAVEMMFKSPLIQELIRTKRDSEIPDAIEKEHKIYDSISFNRVLFKMTLENKITEDQAYQFASSPADLKLMFTISPEYEKQKLNSGKTPELK